MRVSGLKITIGVLIVAFILIVIAGIAVFILSNVLHVISNITITTLAYAIIILLGGVILTSIISSLIKKTVSASVSATVGEGLKVMTQLVGYVVTLVAVFSLIKIGLTSILFSGTVVGLVLGLASQDVLSNVFGGLVLFTSRPFSIGDRITVSTWQYGLDIATYPPKYYSYDFLIPGYTGVVTDISLIYTSIVTDDGVPLKIPNSIMIQAAVFAHNEEKRRVRTRYEISNSIDPRILIPRLEKNIKSLDFIVGDPAIRIIETTMNSYVIVVEAICKGQYEEPPRHEIIIKIMDTVKGIQSEIQNESSPSNGSGKAQQTATK